MGILNSLFQPEDMQRYVKRFVTVGTMGTLIDIGLFTALRVVFGVPTLPANTISCCAGMVNNFVLHRCWTYAGRTHKSAGAQFTQFAAVSFSALLVNNLLVLLLAQPLGILFAHPTSGDFLAKLFATGLGMCWSFLANNFWTFRAVPERRTA